jgi:hypothetical protein
MRPMAISRSQRRREREPSVSAAFGEALTPPALDLLELVEFAWHDCFGEIAPPDKVIDDILVISGGRLDALIAACRLAIEDWRDLRVAADKKRIRS